jgi:hypothetical protein
MFLADDMDKLEACGKRLLSPDTVADYFGLPRREVRLHLEQDNEAAKRYRKGVALTMFDVQGTDIDFAKLGAPNAIKNVLHYIERIP